MCCRGACIECFPEPKNGWVYLCKICDKDVQKIQVIPETMISARQKKGKEGQQAGSEVFSQVATQNSFATLAAEDDDDIDDIEEEERLEEEERRREDKKKNKEGARKSQEEERKRRTEEKEKELCKLFKFGGKCPHGMNGLRKHNH